MTDVRLRAQHWCLMMVLVTQELQIHSPQRSHFHAWVALAIVRYRSATGESLNSLDSPTPKVSRTGLRLSISSAGMRLLHNAHLVTPISLAVGELAKMSDENLSLFSVQHRRFVPIRADNYCQFQDSKRPSGKLVCQKTLTQPTLWAIIDSSINN